MQKGKIGFEQQTLCLSLLKANQDSINVLFERRADLLNFVIALSELASRVNPFFFRLTSRKLISFFLVRAKIQQIASLSRLTVAQLFGAALFNAAVTMFAKDVARKESKLNGLLTLARFCKRHRVPSGVLRLDDYEQLKTRFTSVVEESEDDYWNNSDPEKLDYVLPEVSYSCSSSPESSVSESESVSTLRLQTLPL